MQAIFENLVRIELRPDELEPQSKKGVQNVQLSPRFLPILRSGLIPEVIFVCLAGRGCPVSICYSKKSPFTRSSAELSLLQLAKAVI